MKAFTYQRASSLAQAAVASAQPNTRIIAGGTNLLDLMKLEVETPAHLVDINRLDLDRIEDTQDGGLRIGAVVRDSDLAADTLRCRPTTVARRPHASRVSPAWRAAVLISSICAEHKKKGETPC